MTNYKPWGYSFHTSGHQIIPKLFEETQVTLISNLASVQVAKSLFDTADGLVYTVPSGKTLKVRAIHYHPLAALALVNIYQGDTLDAETLLKSVLDLGATETETQINVQFDIAATKYITITPSVVNALADLTLFGVLE